MRKGALKIESVWGRHLSKPASLKVEVPSGKVSVEPSTGSHIFRISSPDASAYASSSY